MQLNNFLMVCFVLQSSSYQICYTQLQSNIFIKKNNCTTYNMMSSNFLHIYYFYIYYSWINPILYGIVKNMTHNSPFRI